VAFCTTIIRKVLILFENKEEKIVTSKRVKVKKSKKREKRVKE
jgi:hypothetical protein